ncbi:MAG: DNA polymerase Y family protein [Sphingomonadales bacterium]|nr:DNA polymerase Y family protein [Sphingomonadales bacterium]
MFSGNRRYLALFFPLLSADRWQREAPSSDSVPRVFVEKRRGAMRLVALDAHALSLGLVPGMALADARARVPDLATNDHNPAADAALLVRMADDCDRYTPMVALDPPDGLILDITGCAHIWGSEAALVADLAARLGRAGLRVQHALAETPDRARALARHGSAPSILALDLDEERTTALRRAGLTTIADLAVRPRSPLAARFGTDMVAKLARLLGEEDIRITPRRVPPALFVMRRFAEPIAATDYVLATLEALADEARDALREHGEGGRRFAASLFRSDGDVRQLFVETGQPTRDPALLMRLFRERIEALADPLDPGFGYDAVRLDIAVTEPLGPVQTGLATPVSGDAEVAGLVDRLSTRLGRNRVQRLGSRDTHIPEQACFTFPANDPPDPMPWPKTTAGEPPLRPLHLFDPPQPILAIAEVPDGPPRRFQWRRRTHLVVRYEGPERIASEWWRRREGHEAGKGGMTRDYFRVEDERGRRFWLFRHGLYGTEARSPDWYLHGLFA